MLTMLKVLDKGFCRYVTHAGNDSLILEAARQSTGGKSKGDEADKKLLFYLYRNRHTSPFEMCNITFSIKMPIFVMRQFVRHRTFRLNEFSARYTEMPDEFYIPKKWRTQDTKNKQGSNEGNLNHDILNHELIETYKICYKQYEMLLANGVAREMARMVLPVNIYTKIYVNCDLHNLMHFLRLRLDPHAQWEIQQYAKAMLQIAKSYYPWTFEAFKKYKMKMVEELNTKLKAK